MADNQMAQIAQHLEEHGKITSWEAIQLYGITRLSAVIYNVKRCLSIDIKTTSRVGKNRNGKTVHYTEYYVGAGNERI